MHTFTHATTRLGRSSNGKHIHTAIAHDNQIHRIAGREVNKSFAYNYRGGFFVARLARELIVGAWVHGIRATSFRLSWCGIICRRYHKWCLLKASSSLWSEHKQLAVLVNGPRGRWRPEDGIALLMWQHVINSSAIVDQFLANAIWEFINSSGPTLWSGQCAVWLIYGPL